MASSMVSVADLGARLAELLTQLQKAHAPIYVTQRGRVRAVLLAVGEYDGLLDRLEYLDDSLMALAAKGQRESGREGSQRLEIVMRELRKPAARGSRGPICRKLR